MRIEKQDATVRIDGTGRDFARVRAEFEEELIVGSAVICPCCERHCHYDGRVITDAMVQQLWFLSKQVFPISGKHLQPEPNGKWRLYSLLRHWGFAERVDADSWIITEAGRAFIHGKIDAPRKVFLFNDGKVGESPDRIDVAHALKTHTNLGDIFVTTAEIATGSRVTRPSP